eukprot:gene11902-biopygen4757
MWSLSVARPATPPRHGSRGPRVFREGGRTLHCKHASGRGPSIGVVCVVLSTTLGDGPGMRLSPPSSSVRALHWQSVCVFHKAVWLNAK